MSDDTTFRNRPYVSHVSAGAAPQQIGPYRILRSIGEGGMGSVFLAEQDAPVRRKVAVKVIRSPFSRAEDRIRFQGEQQAMARLQHPNVAQMFEAGTTAEGYPFFVMEWLDGESIVDYCDHNSLSVDERLSLFLGVCDGVQHAHQKAIVHRDLKPSNILVVEIDGRPVAKIIDFGVAKALDAPLVEATAPTGDGIVGTPAYLSPEAVTGAQRADLDTRADVYALGCVLYKLLAGKQPFETEELLFDRMVRIAQSEVPTPAQFFAGFEGEERETVATRRATSPAALDRILRSDLEPIILKAMARDRDERYGSASGLQADIRRYLAHEPVEASSPSTFDRVRKFAVRHRSAVAATLLIVIALVGGIVARTIEARRAKAAQAQAELVTNFLIDLFNDSMPWNGGSNEVSMHDLLRAGAKRIEGRLEDVPLARAQILNSIGSALLHQGDDELAYKLLRDALELRRRELGADDPLVASTLVELGVMRQRYDLAEGERYLREAVRIREKILGPDDVWLANSLADLADIRRRQKAFGDGEQMLLRSLAIRRKALPPDDPSIAASLSGLGQLYRDWRKFDLAEKNLFEALAIRTKVFGPDHYVTSRSYDSISMLRAMQKRWPEAEDFLRRDLAIVERVRGPEHKYAAWVRVDLAETLLAQNRVAEGREMLVQALPKLEHAADLQDVYKRGNALLRRYPE
ncbi:MAG TPA: serine/threonine-protein kinase [Thermoanaerobaculia bacterium]|jgi:non-specific serine/threonine protein kinase/serine/threonine-protein kinase|nr:serine/threonine-protein kinase [Thermoanaerobaculia bacterium]